MPNMLNINEWTVSSGSIGNFSQNGSTIENYRGYNTDPWGNNNLIWESMPSGDAQADGGWNTSFTNINNTLTYRFSSWINRVVQGNGSLYLGTNGYNSSNAETNIYRRSDGVGQTNPYFYSTTPTVSNTWCLYVGHVFPYTAGAGALHPDTGRYLVNGTKITTGFTDFYWNENHAKSRHRSYLYYSSNLTTVQRWIYPRMEPCDGTEPTITQLLRNGEYFSAVNTSLGCIPIKFRDVIN